MTKTTAWLLTLLEAVRFPGRTISDDVGDPYLSRFYLTPDADWWREYLPGVFLHYFHRGDYEREPHNHPWEWGFSFILSGGYYDNRRDPKSGEMIRRKFIPGDVNRVEHLTFHRVDMIDEERGAWTLFVAGPGIKIRRGIRKIAFWGYLLANGGFELWIDRDERIGKVGAS